jgi:wyosine [tRNA(Phe)-imidazoG37] synthetase (radical SAM superfamily)
MNKIRKDYEFPQLEQIKLSFREYVKKTVPTDHIVISGNGEPTLYPQFEEAVQLVLELRNEHMPQTKVICLSNGAHLDAKKVISGMNLLDERVIKVDAGSDGLMQKVNDPLVRINMAKFLSGVRKLRDCTVQALFVDGENGNANPELLDDWMEVIGMIKPKAVQLCTLTRPGFNPNVRAVEDDVLYGIAFKLKKRTSLESQVFVAQKG